MSKFDLFSDDYLNSLPFKTEYGRNILVQSITVLMRVLTNKINVSLFIDLIALYMNLQATFVTIYGLWLLATGFSHIPHGTFIVI